MAIPIAVPIAIAAAGAISSMYGADRSAQAQKRAAEAAQTGAAEAAKTISSSYGSMSNIYGTNAKELEAFGSKINSIYDPDTVEANTQRYKEILSEDTGSQMYNPGEFTYGNTIESFFDPVYKLNIQTQLDALDNSAASAGHLYSSGLRRQAQGLASKLGMEAYKEAREAYFKDKTLALDKYKAEEANKAEAAKIAQNRYKNLIDAFGGYTKDYLGISSDLLSEKINNRNQGAAAYQNAVNAYAQQVAAAGGKDVGTMPVFNTYNLGIEPF